MNKVISDFEKVFSKFDSSEGQIVPFGYIQCTVDKQPRVLRINQQMLHFLGLDQGEIPWEDYLCSNIFFMLPFGEREGFRASLKKALVSDMPVPIHHFVTKGDGTNAEAFGKISVLENASGERVFSIFYYDFKERKDCFLNTENNAYFAALKSAYNVIFEIDYEQNTVQCIYGRETSDIGKLWDVQMTIESAVNFWTEHYVVEEDREQMSSYLHEIATPGLVEKAHRPLQIEFRILWEDGLVYSFIGVTIALSKTASLFCCRDTAKVQYSSLQAREVHALRRLHRYMQQSFEAERNASASALMAMDDARCLQAGKKTGVVEDSCHFDLIYASKSLLDYLNIRYDRYLHLLETGLSMRKLREITAVKQISKIDRLFLNGEMRAKDPETGASIVLTCAMQSSGVLLVLASEDVPGAVAGVPAKGVFARTFGHFDLFVDGRPVVFTNEKEKELLALLIDRNGGNVGSNAAIASLWEDAQLTEAVRVRYRKLAMGLKKTLTRYGIQHILISENGVRRVDTAAFTCDYYELLKGNVKYVQSFHNSYMSDYAWAEQTLGTLWDYS